MKGEKTFFGKGAVFMELTLQEKRKLINFFEFLLDEEVSKPLGEMNSEAVDNYIKILLHLQDKHVDLSPEFIDEQVRKIFHSEEKTASPEAVKTTKKYFNKKKIWLVAACIAILVALFSVISFSCERSVKDIMEDIFGTLEVIPSGREITKDNISYGKNGEKNIYSSVKELSKAEKIDVLYPSEDIAVVKHISIGKTVSNEEITIAFDNSDLFMSITLNSEIPQETIDFCNDKTTLNGVNYYLCILEDVNKAQAYFVYNGNLYDITYTNKEYLMEILKNMAEIKYED